MILTFSGLGAPWKKLLERSGRRGPRNFGNLCHWVNTLASYLLILSDLVLVALWRSLSTEMCSYEIKKIGGSVGRGKDILSCTGGQSAGPSGRAVWGVGLRPLACWDRGFESHRGHGCLSVVSVVCCQVEVSATSWSLVQRTPTDCDASLCVIKKPQKWGGHDPQRHRKQT